MQYQHDNGPPLFTFAAMAAFIAFFGAEFKHFDLTKFQAFPWRVADGEIWRLITCTFLHGSILHIAFNAILFLRFSTVIDNWLGPWAALALYVAFALSASAAQLLVSPVGVIGASGVVYGLFAFLWVMSRRRDDAAEAANQHIIQTLLGWLAICVVVNLLGGNIGNTAHLMGLIVGWLLGQTVVARKKLRLPMALATLIVWALPILLIQRPIWNHTLAYFPPFSGWHQYYNPPPDVRDRLEDPENTFNPGLF